MNPLIVAELVVNACLMADAFGYRQPQVPEQKPAQVAITYKEAHAAAVNADKPLIVFVRCQPAEVPGAFSCRKDDFPEVRAGVVVAMPASGHLWYTVLPTNATVANIRAEMERRKERPREATFFHVRASAEAADGEKVARGPWLSGGEERMRQYWPKDIEWPEGIKFYNLPRKYQNLWTTFSVPQWRADDLHNESADFTMSGGLADVRGNWLSVKGLSFPKGSKMLVWKEDTNVAAYAPTPRIRWQYPVGTKAFATTRSLRFASKPKAETDGMARSYSRIPARPRPVSTALAGRACPATRQRARCSPFVARHTGACAGATTASSTTNRMGLKLWGPPKTTARQPVKGIYDTAPPSMNRNQRTQASSSPNKSPETNSQGDTHERQRIATVRRSDDGETGIIQWAQKV